MRDMANRHVSVEQTSCQQTDMLESKHRQHQVKIRLFKIMTLFSVSICSVQMGTRSISPVELERHTFLQGLRSDEENHESTDNERSATHARQKTVTPIDSTSRKYLFFLHQT
jgi:hypothetical protein